MPEREDEKRGRVVPVPAPDDSWARHIRVLESVEQIRRTRARRPEKASTRPTRNTGA